MENAVSCKKRIARKLLIFAIVFEVLAVAAGLALAGGAMYEAINGATELKSALLINASLGTIPFVLVAITEAAKIPLTYSFFNVSGITWRLIIALSLIAVAGITFLSAVTGFERAYTVRAAGVENLQQKVASTDREIANINERNLNRQAQRTALVDQLKQIDAQEMREIEQHTERCKAVGARCNSKLYIDEIRSAAEAKRAPLRPLLTEIDSELRRVSMTALLTARDKATADLMAARNENSIIRLAARVHGKSVEDVTVEETTFVAKTWFGSIGIIVAVTGIILAGVAALLSRPAPRPSKLSQALRLTLRQIRKRSRIEVIRFLEVPGPERVVEKIVEKPFDRVVEKIVEKPVDRVRKIIVYVPQGYQADEIDKANVEAVIEAQFDRTGRPELRQVAGRAA